MVQYYPTYWNHQNHGIPVGIMMHSSKPTNHDKHWNYLKQCHNVKPHNPITLKYRQNMKNCVDQGYNGKKNRYIKHFNNVKQNQNPMKGSVGKQCLPRRTPQGMTEMFCSPMCFAFTDWNCHSPTILSQCPVLWDYKADRHQQPANPYRQPLNTAPDEPPPMRAIWFPKHGALCMKLSHIISNSQFASWLNSFDQLYLQTPGYKLLNIKSLVITTTTHEQGQSDTLYMNYDQDTFTLALAILGQANYFHPYTTLDPLQFLRAIAHLQPYIFPIEIMVSLMMMGMG